VFQTIFSERDPAMTRRHKLLLLRGRVSALSLLGLSNLTACAAKPSSGGMAPHAGVHAGASAGEVGGESGAEAGEAVSVRPGVNDRYFKDGAAGGWSKVFEREGREVVDERDAIVAAIGLEAGARVADVGAGTGLFVAALADAVGDAGTVVAVDIAPAFLDRLRERFERDARVEVRRGTPTDAGLEPASLDLVFMSDVYHHIEYPSTYLPTLRAALVQGGELVVVDFRRIEGVTSPSMLKHVRADQATVRAEIEAAGFVHVEDRDWMRENYFMRFRAP